MTEVDRRNRIALIVYLSVFQGIGGAIINLIINGLLAWATYDGAESVRMWKWPTTMGADVILTALLIPLITWFIAGSLARVDYRKGKWLFHTVLPPVPYPKFLYPVRSILRPEDLFRREHAIRKFALKFLRELRGGLLYSLPYVVLGGIIAGVMTGIFTHTEFSLNASIAFKAGYGAIFSLFVTPVVAYFGLACAAEDAQRLRQSVPMVDRHSEAAAAV
eukprot:GILK01009191.1.p1 GENE.GILK01009191.1~~GILK01009191.1.p1  ORF type:complete len:219 (+),score=21.62 GILK01009191.1:40-696(+)